MVGFLELFVAWLVLAVWGAVLGGRPGAPSQTSLIVWATGMLLGLSVVAGFYGIYAAFTGTPEVVEPGQASLPPPDTALRYALYAAHAVLVMGYLAMIGITGRWLVRREA